MAIKLEDVKEFLKNNLEINLSISEVFGNDRTMKIKVELLLEGETITSSYENITLNEI